MTPAEQRPELRTVEMPSVVMPGELVSYLLQ